MLNLSIKTFFIETKVLSVINVFTFCPYVLFCQILAKHTWHFAVHTKKKRLSSERIYLRSKSTTIIRRFLISTNIVSKRNASKTRNLSAGKTTKLSRTMYICLASIVVHFPKSRNCSVVMALLENEFLF